MLFTAFVNYESCTLVTWECGCPSRNENRRYMKGVSVSLLLPYLLDWRRDIFPLWNTKNHCTFYGTSAVRLIASNCICLTYVYYLFSYYLLPYLLKRPLRFVEIHSHRPQSVILAGGGGSSFILWYTLRPFFRSLQLYRHRKMEGSQLNDINHLKLKLV
jgi:hypothetical protein